MKEKENWIELLRVVSMFMVIGRHIVGALNMQELLSNIGGGEESCHSYGYAYGRRYSQ